MLTYVVLPAYKPHRRSIHVASRARVNGKTHRIHKPYTRGIRTLASARSTAAPQPCMLGVHRSTRFAVCGASSMCCKSGGGGRGTQQLKRTNIEGMAVMRAQLRHCQRAACGINRLKNRNNRTSRVLAFMHTAQAGANGRYGTLLRPHKAEESHTREFPENFKWKCTSVLQAKPVPRKATAVHTRSNNSESGPTSH